MGHEVRSSIMVRGELEPLEFSFDIQKFQAHKSLDEKKIIPIYLPIYHARFKRFQSFIPSFSFPREFIHSDIDVPFTIDDYFRRILENLHEFSSRSRFRADCFEIESLRKISQGGSTPGRGNNFPRNDCVMKAFNTGGVTLGSSPLEIRTVTLRDIWKGCNLRELRSTAELMCKLRHNSCSSRGSRLSIVGRRNFFLG